MGTDGFSVFHPQTFHRRFNEAATMADFGFALLFLLFSELLSLPLRFLLVLAGLKGSVCRVLSRIAGSILLLLPVWALSHQHGMFLSRGFGWFWICLVTMIPLWLLLRKRTFGIAQIMGYEVTAGRKGIRARDLSIELISLFLFLGFIAFRRMVPEMTFQVNASGAEKFANAMFFWSTWHAEFLPPDDYWYSGHALHYYYWGHFHWSWLTRIGFFPAEISLNLAFARLVTLVWESCWLLARSLNIRNSWACIGALAICWGGNPQALIDLIETLRSSPESFSWTHYSFWGPSRAIANIVDEFPVFSAILGDFHAHHLALPWFIAWLAVTTAGFRWLTGKCIPGPGKKYALVLLFAVWSGLGLSACLANLWNLPLILFVLFILLLVQFCLTPRTACISLGGTLMFILLLVGSMHLLMGEATSALSTASGNEGKSLPVKGLDPEFRTIPKELFMMWGFPIIWIMLFTTCLTIKKRQRITTILWLAGQLMICFGWYSGPGPSATLIWTGCGLLISMVIISRPLHVKSIHFGYLIGILAVLIGVEWLYIADRFDGSDLRRYNSYFKLTYPVWPVFITFGILVAQSTCRAMQKPAIRHILIAIPALCFISAMMIYPARAIPARIGQARLDDLPGRQPTLNAWDFIKDQNDKSDLDYRSELPLLQHIRNHVPPGEPVLEAAWPMKGSQKSWPGGYGYGGRIASLAGHPTLMGWQHHEHQWRGRDAYEPTRRLTGEIDAFYRSADAESMRRRAEGLDIRWVIFGAVEFDHYGPHALLTMKKAAARTVFSTPGRRGREYFLFDFTLRGSDK